MNSVDFYTLSPLVSIACACILEDTIDSLTILGKIGIFGQVSAEYAFEESETKCSSYVPEIQLYEPETIAEYKEALLRARYLKFQRDLSYITQILTETMASLSNSKTFSCIKNRVDNYYANLKFEEEVFLSYQINQKSLNNVENLFDQERLQNNNKLQQLSETIGQIKDQIEDLNIENNIKLHYTKDWEDSRLEQNDLRLDNAEGAFINTINNYKTEIDREMRINAEIEAYILEIQQDYTVQIQQWMERYDAEIEFRDTEIQMLKEKREDQFNRLYELSELFEKHREEINEYMEMKEKERLEEEHRQKLIRAAIRIQAWWRGTMVRKCLGPYKVKKGPKGPTPKGKGKGKK